MTIFDDQFSVAIFKFRLKFFVFGQMLKYSTDQDESTHTGHSHF